MAVQIIVDSTADFSAKEIEKRQITCIPMTVTFGNEQYIDGVDLTKEEFFVKLTNEKEFPKTSQPSPAKFADCFEEAKENGDDVVAILVSGALSGTVQSATIAKDIAEHDGVYIVDSKSATLGIRLLVDRAVRMRDQGKSAKEIAEATGSKTIAIQCDVTKKDQVEAMVAKVVDTYGKLDACYNNAGIAVNAPAEEMTFEQWQKVIDINLTGVFLCATAAGRVMLKQGYGSIINTASMSGHIVNVPQPQCAYNASKAGVSLLTKSLAVEWAKRGVRVNCISPGYIGTELIMNAEHLKPLIEQWNAMAPMGRLGKPEELQSILVYLAGDTSTFTTGSDIIVDGAFTCF